MISIDAKNHVQTKRFGIILEKESRMPSERLKDLK